MGRSECRFAGRGVLALLLSVALSMIASGTAAPAAEVRVGQARLTFEPGDIVCRDGPFPGLKGTLHVPQDRAAPQSRQIALPIVVVKSVATNPAFPIFQCGGGPGLSNIKPAETIGESELANHDVVQVGYRGVDGTPNLNEPLFAEVLKTPDLLTPSGALRTGRKLAQAVEKLKTRGIYVQDYNILNVVDDIEAARASLGYEKINLTGGSYGGAVVLTYCLRYPERVNHAVMVEAAFPYDIAFGTPRQVDARFEHLNELWRKDPVAAQRSPDIVQTMRTALQRLPSQWNGVAIDKSKVLFLTYFGMYSERSNVNMVFDAYVAAEKGDFGSVAAMPLLYDQFMGLFQNVGDLLAKTYSSVTDPDRDFVAELTDPDSVIGSPMALMAWGAFQHSGWPVKPVMAEHPPTQVSPVETLIVYGSKEMGGPPKERYAGMFAKARWVMLDDLGHNDIWTLTGPGMLHLIQRFVDDGTVDTSRIGAIPRWDFTPQMTFQQMLQYMTQQAGATPAQD